MLYQRLNEVHKNVNSKVCARRKFADYLKHNVLLSSFHLREFYPQTQ